MTKLFEDAIFIAYPLGGKDTQAGLLIETYKNMLVPYLYLATGECFRKIEKGNYTSILIKDMMDNGTLVPDFLATGLVSSNLIQSMSQEKTLILNGFPRNKKQGLTFIEMMYFYKRSPKIIIIEVSPDEIMKRLEERKQIETRTDDREEVVKKRLRIFEEENTPLVELLSKHFNSSIINGNGTIENTQKQIIEALKIA
jgi:adenylate kinase